MSQNDNSIRIGAMWLYKSQKGNDYMSLAFTGDRQEDRFEVVVRDRQTGQILPLFDKEAHKGVRIFSNRKKASGEASANSPDGWIFVSLD